MNNPVTYQDAIRACPVDLVHALTDRLPSLWSQVAREREYADLGGYEDPCEHRQKEIAHLIGKLKRAHAELGQLRRHAHEWGSDDYCLICGADGRA